MARIDGSFLTSRQPLRVSNAVAAIVVVDRDCYLMQLRDDIPGIWYPGHWGLFGGAVDAGEDEMSALRRELREELELELQAASLFVRFDFDLTPMGLARYWRAYYEVAIDVRGVQAAGVARRRGDACAIRRRRLEPAAALSL